MDRISTLSKNEVSLSDEKSDRPRSNLRDQAYQSFMNELYSGNLRPGLLVSQRELCGLTDTTIGAMREALKRLEAEGVVSLIPQRGVKVRELGEKEINEVYEVRKILESHSAKCYAENGDLSTIVDIKEQTQDVLNRKSETREDSALLSRARFAVDDLLHQKLFEHLGNSALLEITEKLKVQIHVNRLAVQPRFVDSRPALKEHLRIIEAIENRDGEGAAQTMIDHLEAGRRRAVGIE